MVNTVLSSSVFIADEYVVPSNVKKEESSGVWRHGGCTEAGSFLFTENITK